MTELIEHIAWFQAERTQIKGLDEVITFTGAPVSFVFPTPLEISTFQNFVSKVFEGGGTAFRLWGNPIYLGNNKVHVYGVDMHLWQKIYMELTPSRFIVVLPKDTCGNTVHRLITNLQRYLSPDVQVYVGEHLYRDIILDILLGRGEVQ